TLKQVTCKYEVTWPIERVRMKRIHRLVVALLGSAVLLLSLGLTLDAPDAPAQPADPGRPELAYLKQVNAWRPPADPQLLFLLMAQYANAGRHAEGAEYIDTLRRRFDAQLNDKQRALYLTAIASLRAGAAQQVFVLKRLGWVHDTVAMLDEAQRLSHGELFITHWMSGVVRAQLPGFFGERDAAQNELRWCVQHADKAPHPGWLREVYFRLAALQRAGGDLAQAQRNQALSGYTALDKPVLFTTPFSGDATRGHSFSARTIREVVPGSVYVASGFEFTE